MYFAIMDLVTGGAMSAAMEDSPPPPPRCSSGRTLEQIYQERDDTFAAFQATHKTDWGVNKPGTPLQKAKRLRLSLMAELGNHLPEDVGTRDRNIVIEKFTAVNAKIKTLQKRKVA